MDLIKKINELTISDETMDLNNEIKKINELTISDETMDLNNEIKKINELTISDETYELTISDETYELTISDETLIECTECTEEYYLSDILKDRKDGDTMYDSDPDLGYYFCWDCLEQY
jgi:hypothetical protein